MKAVVEYKCMSESGPVARKPPNLTYEDAASISFGGQPDVRLLERSAASSGEMLFKTAFVLLVAWLLGVVGAYRAGELVHVLLLVGLMLLLLAFL